MQRLRTVTSLDVSAVAGHHAMPAALLFFTSDEYVLYFFTIANRGCFDNLGLNFFQKRSEMSRSCLKKKKKKKKKNATD